MDNRLQTIRRITSYRSGIRNALGGFVRTLVFVIRLWGRLAGRAIGAVRSVVLALLWFVGYWIGRVAGAVARLILWFVGAVVRGFQDAW